MAAAAVLSLTGAALTGGAGVASAGGVVPAVQSRAPSASPAFTIAVVPDTQAETAPGQTRFENRIDWLVRMSQRWRLRYVLHTGDITNWGWLDRPQFVKARAAMGRLTRAGIPYAVAAGNHDGRAVGWNGIPGSTGYGGSAYMYNPECPGRLGKSVCWSWILNRMTDEFNQYFDESTYGGLAGQFEAGKTENSYTFFSAGGKQFMVLTLELWPRQAVVAWANRVVAANPRRNVLIQTHAYLDGQGRISGSNGGYGATSPRYLFDHLVKRHPNIKMVFSGHMGRGAKRTDRGIHGNLITSYLFNDAGPSVNPVRVVRINTQSGRVGTTVYSPMNRQWMTQYRTVDRLQFVG